MRFALIALLWLAACNKDESVSAFVTGSGVYALRTFDGVQLAVPITLDLSEPGQVSGRAPCNSYSAAQTAPYPWFQIGDIATTRRACATRRLEHRYLTALSRMTIVEVSGTVLILTNDSGAEMVFDAS